MAYFYYIRLNSYFIIIFLITSKILLTSFNTNGQTINKGIQYNQQLAYLNNVVLFFSWSIIFKCFSRQVVVSKVLHFFNPSIYLSLYNIYGGKDCQADSNRRGLKSAGIYCYSTSSAYTFKAFLEHNYINLYNDDVVKYNQLEHEFLFNSVVDVGNDSRLKR